MKCIDIDKTFMTYPYLGLKLKQVVFLYSKTKHVKSISCVCIALKVISLIQKINDFPNSQSMSNIKWTFLLVDHGKGCDNNVRTSRKASKDFWGKHVKSYYYTVSVDSSSLAMCNLLVSPSLF